MNLSLSDNEASGKFNNFLLVEGSYWKGSCTYHDSDDTYPFTLTVCQVSEDSLTVEGLIEWPTINKTITKFLGMVIHKSSQIEFKFREYEAIRGEDEVQLPVNYKGTLSGNHLSGKVAVKNENISFALDFSGIRSPKEGFKELFSKILIPKNPNRKYNLHNNNSLERPSMQDQQMAFKRLTKGSDLWYDPKQVKGPLQPRTREEIDAAGYRPSCINCGNPLFASATEIDATKKTLVCSNYPNCEPSEAYFFIWFIY